MGTDRRKGQGHASRRPVLFRLTTAPPGERVAKGSKQTKGGGEAAPRTRASSHALTDEKTGHRKNVQEERTVVQGKPRGKPFARVTAPPETGDQKKRVSGLGQGT